MPAENGLLAAFTTLVQDAPKKYPDLQVEEENDAIVLTTSAINVKPLLEELQTIFKSHGHTQARLSFRLKNESRLSTVEMNLPQVEFPLAQINHLKGDEIFQRLFSQDLRANTGMIVQWEAARGQGNQTIYYYLCPDAEVDLRIQQINRFKNVLSHATWEELYLALAHKNPRPLPSPSERCSTKGQGPLSPHVDTLLRFGQGAGKKVVYFDCVGLVKCVVSPEFTLNDKGKIYVDKSHFMAYMSTLLQEGILLRPEENHLRPISFHPQRAVQANTLIEFGVDCSGSMRDNNKKNKLTFTNLKACLKELVSKFPEHLKSDMTTIRFSFFGSIPRLHDSISFPLSELDRIKAAVDSFKNPDRDQQTALYEFLVTQYEQYEKETQEYNNIVFILVSDGGDTCSSLEYKPKQDNSDKLSQTLKRLAQSSNPPKFFSLEIGDVSDNVLSTLENLIQGNFQGVRKEETRIKVGNDLKEFEKFYKHMAVLGEMRHFFHFVQDARSFRLPAIEGQVLMSGPQERLNVNQPFSINGTSYTAQRHAGAAIVLEESKTGSEKSEVERLREQINSLNQRLNELTAPRVQGEEKPPSFAPIVPGFQGQQRDPAPQSSSYLGSVISSCVIS